MIPQVHSTEISLSGGSTVTHETLTRLVPQVLFVPELGRSRTAQVVKFVTGS